MACVDTVDMQFGIGTKLEKLGYLSLVNFLLQQQNTLAYSGLTDTKPHVHEA